MNGSFNRSMSRIVFNTESDMKYATLFHEAFGEFSEAWNGKEMEQFQNDLLEWFFDNYDGKGDDVMNRIIKKYQDIYAQKQGTEGYREAANEMINDALAGLFNTEDGIKDFTDWLYENKSQKEAKTVIRKIAELIKELCEKIRSFLLDNEDVSGAAKKVMEMEADHAAELRRRLLDIVDKAAENYRNNAENKENQGNVKYSLMEFSDDKRRFVEIDQEQYRFEGHDRREYPRIAKEIINEKFNGKVIGLDNKMFVNGHGRDEFSNPSKYIQGNVYEAKMRSAGELDNLLDAGTNLRNEADGRDGHYHSDVINGFDYYDTLFKIGDRYYEAVINIKNIKRGRLFKDVTKIKDVTQDIMSSYGKNPKSQFLRTSSTDSLSQNEEKATENVKTSAYPKSSGNGFRRNPVESGAAGIF